jgi:hypothetical protein
MRKVEGRGRGAAQIGRGHLADSSGAVRGCGGASTEQLLLRVAEDANAEGRGSDEVRGIPTTMEDARVVDLKWTCASR